MCGYGTGVHGSPTQRPSSTRTTSASTPTWTKLILSMRRRQLERQSWSRCPVRLLCGNTSFPISRSRRRGRATAIAAYLCRPFPRTRRCHPTHTVRPSTRRRPCGSLGRRRRRMTSQRWMMIGTSSESSGSTLTELPDLIVWVCSADAAKDRVTSCLGHDQRSIASQLRGIKERFLFFRQGPHAAGFPFCPRYFHETFQFHSCCGCDCSGHSSHFTTGRT